jgi:S1-C subfamily serine protease
MAPPLSYVTAALFTAVAAASKGPATAPAQEGLDDFSSKYEVVKKSVVRITTYSSVWYWGQPYQSGGLRGSVGSGFFVSTEPMLIQTCAHVVENAKYVYIQVPAAGKKKYKASVATVCSEGDVATVLIDDDEMLKKDLKLANSKVEALSFAPGIPALGMPVYATGYPLGQLTMKISEGVIAGVDHVSFNFRNLALQSTAIISSGNSGSPLLDKSFMIVGMNYAKMPSEAQINYAVPSYRLQQVLSKHWEVHGKAAAVKQLYLYHLVSPGISITPATPAFYERGSGGCRKGPVISMVFPNSRFERAKPPVEEDSFLVAIDGVDIDSFGQGMNANYINELVDYTDLLYMRSGTGDGDVRVTTCDPKRGAVQDSMVSMAWSKEHDGKAIRHVFEPQAEGIDWEIFGDLIFMELTENHVTDMSGEYHAWALVRFLSPTEFTEPRLIVMTHTSGGSGQDSLGVSDSTAAVVESVNGQKVRTLSEFRKAFLPSPLDDMKPAFMDSLSKLSANLPGLSPMDRTSLLQRRQGVSSGPDHIWSVRTDVGKEFAAKFRQTLATQMMDASQGSSYLMTGCALAAASHLGLMSAGNSTSLVSTKKKALRQQPLIAAAADPVPSADVADDEKSMKNAKMCTSPLLVKERQGTTAVLEFAKGEEDMKWRP